MPDVFHRGSRLEEVPEVVVTPESPREVLTLDEDVRHAPRDINWEHECLVDFSRRQLLNQPDDVRD